MSLPHKCIVFLGRTLSGHHPDYRRLQQALPPAVDWFTDLHMLVDLGSLGMPSDSRGEQIAVPHKQPRKRKTHPNPHLSGEQKAAKKAVSRVRIFVEHAMGGMQRYTILVHGFRNRKADVEDDAIGICAGLWNLVLSY